MVASDQDTRSFDFYGVDALGYKIHRREAIEVGTRAMFRLTNFRFAVGTHMARDILYLVPAASTAFLDFLEEAHQIAKGGVWNPSYFEGHNVLLAFTHSAFAHSVSTTSVKSATKTTQKAARPALAQYQPRWTSPAAEPAMAGPK